MTKNIKQENKKKSVRTKKKYVHALKLIKTRLPSNDPL